MSEGAHDPVHLKMLYPERPGPPGSVDDAHVREMVSAPLAVATTDVGVEGGTESMVTEVVAVLVPFALFAESVYTVVLVGFTVVEPTSVLVERLKPVAERDTEDALEIFQERREEEPLRISVGEAVKPVIIGRMPESVVPEAFVDEGETLPTLSFAVRSYQ